MKLTRCNNGHMYNGAAHKECPYCGGGAGANMSVAESNGSAKMANMEAQSYERNSYSAMDSVSADDDKTVAFWNGGGMEIDPTVGWLVCIHGQDKGKDYKIKSEKNFIGRSEEMDIYIKGDRSISRRNHCIISYNPKQRNFMIIPGDGTGIVYVQNEAVYSPRSLESFDSIEIGESKFVFVPLCGEYFDWKMD